MTNRRRVGSEDDGEGPLSFLVPPEFGDAVVEMIREQDVTIRWLTRGTSHTPEIAPGAIAHGSEIPLHRAEYEEATDYEEFSARVEEFHARQTYAAEVREVREITVTGRFEVDPAVAEDPDAVPFRRHIFRGAEFFLPDPPIDYSQIESRVATWVVQEAADSFAAYRRGAIFETPPDADRTPRGEPLAPLPEWLRKVDKLIDS